ncbi:Cell Wall Hydrolase [Nitrosomonas sp. Nm51]|uniref:cell wall hydrolase n=1 Tax=Nitrosomonas sp. Nm51 TaxID=133720 RepID=UPI0008BF7F35|nr:cell wall hydrolase [Nitrosomonas sp. Nm51]SER69650.1 Cell Wall Hydrolase [Nitrosomonas sp. Nm51]
MNQSCEIKQLAHWLRLFFWSGLVFANGQPSIAEIAKTKAKVLEQEAVADNTNSASSTARIITKPEVRSVDPDGTKPLNDPITCLSRTIYWEARGQKTTEMEAIASVVMNRLSHAGFPDTICAVVTQGNEQGSCQFSWWCDGYSDKADEASYTIAKEIARKALNRQLTDRTHGATFFHHRGIEPDWSSEFIKTFEIGEHIFYKSGAAE